MLEGRATLEAILDRRDPRRFVIVGPCSIHDPVAGLDYAHRLQRLADEVADTLVLVMRVYFEKPRTTTGWKGYINDPDLNDTFRIADGMEQARRFLLAVTESGLPAATEALDPITPQYLGDLIVLDGDRRADLGIADPPGDVLRVCRPPWASRTGPMA